MAILNYKYTAYKHTQINKIDVNKISWKLHLFFTKLWTHCKLFLNLINLYVVGL